jgi:hypothetical protein
MEMLLLNGVTPFGGLMDNWVDDSLPNPVGNPLPKGRVAIRQIAPVFGRKPVLPNGLEFDVLPYTGSSWLLPT